MLIVFVYKPALNEHADESIGANTFFFIYILQVIVSACLRIWAFSVQQGDKYGNLKCLLSMHYLAKKET